MTAVTTSDVAAALTLTLSLDRQGEGTEMDRRSEADLAQERIHCVEQAARIVALDVVAGVLDTDPSRMRQHMSESLRGLVRQHVALPSAQDKRRTANLRNVAQDALAL